MWTYQQKSGLILQNNVIVGNGYSGHGEGLNNPDMEAVHGVGPIPRGLWKMDTPWHDAPHLGPCVVHLEPVGFDPHGRSGFFVHGDNASADHTASDGCIILSPNIRHRMRDSGDTSLTVIA